MKTLLLAGALAFALLSPAAVLADGAHHAPMGPSLSVVCAAKPVAEQFDCLRPGFVVARNSLTTLVSWSSGAAGFSCRSGFHPDPHHPFHCAANPTH